MKTIVYGSWHLAEVHGVGLCRLGHQVTLVSNESVYERYYAQGKPPVFEPGITEGIKEYTQNGKLSFVRSIKEAKKTEVCFFAEDCKFTKKGVDIKDIESKFIKVVRDRKSKIIVISSQIPIGTCRRWQKKFRNATIVYFPEFLRFGDALKRFLEPDSIVLGGDEGAVKKVAAFFKSIRCPKFFVSFEEAEMSKHAANIFVALSVSLVSELTKFSRHFNIDLTCVGQILRMDKRIGVHAYVMPGLGFTGTVERDFGVLMAEGERLGIRLPMLEQAVAVNNEHNRFMEKEIGKRFKTMKKKKIGFLGATYKSFTSNMRGSLIVPLLEKIEKEGGRTAVYDPLVEPNPYTVDSIDNVFHHADAVVIVVEKKEFKDASYPPLLSLMRKKTIIDAANMLPKDFGKKMKIDYSSIGRGR